MQNVAAQDCDISLFCQCGPILTKVFVKVCRCVKVVKEYSHVSDLHPTYQFDSHITSRKNTLNNNQKSSMNMEHHVLLISDYIKLWRVGGAVTIIGKEKKRQE